MKKNFLFYDYETFGLNPKIDKIAQFACVRTDINFNIISSPKIFYCSIPQDYLPDPKAILITSILPNNNKNNCLKEFYFAKKIYNIFNKYLNTCIIGFNNINFDDEFTRNIFYRNFLDPYSWSWKNKNSRWDIINVLRTCFALRPKGINWCFDNKKIPIFKLSKITKLNIKKKFSFHDALSDVLATIEISKLIYLKQPKLFKFLFYFRKFHRLLNILKKSFFKPIIYISSIFGAKYNNIRRVLILTQSNYNKKIFISIDIDNNEKFFNFVNNNYKTKKNLESFFLKNFLKIGMRFINLSKCPILLPITVLLKKNIKSLTLNQKKYYRNLNIFKNFFLNKNHKYLIKFISKFKYFKNIKKCFHSDEQLYSKFFSFKESKKNNVIRILLEKKNFLKLEKIFLSLDNKLKNLLFFCKARNFNIYLNNFEKNSWEKYIHSKINLEKLFLYKKKIYKLIKSNKHNLKNKKILLKLLFFLKNNYNF
ncbi:exodeoxyribonuclease I [Buchnera aphidicola]|uniref:exodeoxyribonuclease I n=1 Tax=Buchnera aphidicola TaxID=9 RepID=UPI0030EF1D1D